MKYPRFISLGIQVLVLFCTNSSSVADEPVGSHQNEYFEREQREIEKLQVRPDIFLPELPSKPIVQEASVEVGPCFSINKIELAGAPPQWKAWLEQALPFSLPMCLNAHHIHFITQTLQKKSSTKAM